MSVLIPMVNGKENQLERKKKRRSADRDMAAIDGLNLSPSKLQNVLASFNDRSLHVKM
jgi:hypothetical protein